MSECNKHILVQLFLYLLILLGVSVERLENVIIDNVIFHAIIHRASLDILGNKQRLLTAPKIRSREKEI